MASSSPSPKETPLLDLVLQVLEEKKAERVRVLDVSAKTAIADYFVVCSATSSTHARTLAGELHFRCKHEGYARIDDRVDRSDTWKLLDFGGVVVHVFLESIRQHYDIEGMWEKKPDMEA